MPKRHATMRLAILRNATTRLATLWPDARVFPRVLAPALIAPLLAAGAVAVTTTPADAQVYVRPYARAWAGPIYAPPVYEPPPGYYYGPPPPVYGPPPAYREPRGMPAVDVEPMLRSMGMRQVGRVRAQGDVYVVDATDPGGARVRLTIDAFTAGIVSVQPIGRPSVAATPRPAGPAPLPRLAPIPPQKPPELAAVTPADQPAPSAPSATSPSATPPSATAAPPPAAAPSAVAPSPAAPKPSAVRVIPGVAVPPGTAPAPAVSTSPPQAGTGTGTGTSAAGATQEAGTASVVARDAEATPAGTR